VTGVGMTATAFHLGRAFNNKYDLAFNFGLAGSFNSNLEKGSVVNIIEDHFSELGAEDGEQFLTLKDIKLDGEQMVINDSVIKNKILENIPKVNGITVNTVHGNEESINKVFERFHPITESMEGAAFLFACKQMGIPHAQIRAVSNYVEKRNKANWNIPLAIENLNKKALEILDGF
jgi:futalosine hydrolase